MAFTIFVFTGLACAIVMRRRSAVHDRLSVAATVILAMAGSTTAGMVVMEVVDWSWGAVPAVVAAGVAAPLTVWAGAWVNRHPIDWIRRRQEASASDPDILTRVENWVDRNPFRLAGLNVPHLTVRVSRRVIEARVTGLAAEMTYYGLISLVPLVTALGASLGFLERIVGTQQVAEIEATLVDAVAGIFAEQVAEDVLAPLIVGLLREERAGIALGSVVITLWLASRMFRAAIRALDDAYQVPERRALPAQWTLGVALALGALATLIVLLVMVVIGPLLGNGAQIADFFGLSTAFEISWAVLRWPAVAAVCVGYLTLLYRYGPNVDTTWTRCLPGAVLGTVGLVAVAGGFATYLQVAGPTAVDIGGRDAAVTAAAQTIGLVLAGVLWLWLSSIVILTGGVVNAELEADRHR